MRSDNVVVATHPLHRRTVMGGGGDAVAVLFNGEPWLPEYNLALAVGSEPRIVPGIRAVDARQSAPHPQRVCVHSDRLVRLRLSHETRGGLMKTDNLHVVHPRAAGLDVHKMQITVSIRICAPGGGEPQLETRTFDALASGLDEMVAWMLDRRIDGAVMEGTGIFWLAPFEALEAAGIPVMLVNAHQVKQLKGRKTDVADSVWLARVCQFGLASPSYVPPKAFREIRVLTRYRHTLVGQRSRVRNRVHKILDRSGVRVGGVLSDVFGANGRRILNGLLEGLDRETIVASLSHHVQHKVERLDDALRLSLSPADLLLLSDLLRDHDALEERLEALDGEIDAGLTPWEDRIVLLLTIPGINRASACAILAEIGPDLDIFGSSERLAAWAGLCPGNGESAGKRRKVKTRRGSKTLRTVLVECAHGAARTRGCQFRGYHKALMVRRGYKRAIVATAHKLLRVIYVVLREGRPYYDPEADYEALMVSRNAPRWIRMLRQHGYLESSRSRGIEANLATA